MTLKERFDFKPLLNFKENWMQICGLIAFLACTIWALFDQTVARLMAVGLFLFISRDLLRWIKVWK